MSTRKALAAALLSLATGAHSAIVQLSCEEVGTIALATKYRAAFTFLQATANKNVMLKSGECMYSPSRSFAVVMQGDGQLVVYDLNKPNTSEWSAGTDGNPGASLLLEGTSKLTVYRSDGIYYKENRPDQPTGDRNKILWSAPHSSRVPASYYLAIQEGGNLVIYVGEPSLTLSRWVWSWQTGLPSLSRVNNRDCWVRENHSDGYREYNKCPY